MPQLMQPAVGSLEKLLDLAYASKPWFEAQVRNFTARSFGRPGGLGLKCDKEQPSKPSQRAYAKAREKDATEGYRFIKDMIRASVSYHSCAEISMAIPILAKVFTVVEVKDHIRKPASGGYADLNTIVVDPDTGLLCELQIHFDQLLAAKSGGGHTAYNAQRDASKGLAIKDMQPGRERGLAQRAIHAGQHAYLAPRIAISKDASQQEMFAMIDWLSAEAQKNEEVYLRRDALKPSKCHQKRVRAEAESAAPVGSGGLMANVPPNPDGLGPKTGLAALIRLLAGHALYVFGNEFSVTRSSSTNSVGLPEVYWPPMNTDEHR